MFRNGAYELREPVAPYKGVFNPENGVLRLENASFWRDNLYISIGYLGPTPAAGILNPHQPQKRNPISLLQYLITIDFYLRLDGK